MFLTLNRNKVITSSYKLKKSNLTNFFRRRSGYTPFYTSFSYNLLRYFLKNNKITLNKVTFYKITEEELGTFISLASWLNNFYNKCY